MPFADFAAAVGVHSTVVCEWLAGRKRPHARNLLKIEAVSGVPVARLQADMPVNAPPAAASS